MYNASRDSETIDGKFVVNMKIAYKPVSQFEIFANAVNLFNNTSREFVYGDRVGGRYSVGVSFGL